MRFFNTAGPIMTDIHYCVPPLERIDLDEVLMLIQQQKYFVMYAPRQTGKTSALLALMDELNGNRRYRCLYINVEIGQSAREDVGAAMRAILSQLASRAECFLGDRVVKKVWREAFEAGDPQRITTKTPPKNRGTQCSTCSPARSKAVFSKRAKPAMSPR